MLAEGGRAVAALDRARPGVANERGVAFGAVVSIEDLDVDNVA